MNGVAVLTYHPEIAVFAKEGTVRKGAWRVARFLPGWSPIEPVCHVGYDYGKQCKALFLDVVRPLRIGTYVNPTTLLREYFARKRLVPMTITLKEKA